jgi:histidinol-phosphate phosphatase family protein
MNRAVFLDRDGTIIHDKNYLSDPAKVVLYKNAARAILKLQRAGFKVIAVTNQSGIARGYFKLSDYKKVTAKMNALLKLEGAKLDGIYFCPHLGSACLCRKPKPQMALDAKKKFNLDLKKSYVIGDSLRDAEFAANFGGTGILVLTGHGKSEVKKVKGSCPYPVTKNIMSAANMILNEKTN